MSAEGKIEIEFDHEVVAYFFDRMRRNHSNIKEKRAVYLNALNAIASTDIDEHFQKQTGPDGSWVKWSDAYRKHMNKIGKGGNKKLQDTGKLRQGAITTNFKPFAGGVKYRHFTKYGPAHQYGAPSKNIPARPYMWFSNKAMGLIEKATFDILLDGI